MSLADRINKRLTRLPAGRHLPRRTVRVRLALLYGGLFLISGAALVAVTYGLFERATEYSKPQLPHIPHTPTIHNLQHNSPPAAFTALPGALSAPGLAQALPQLTRVQHQLRQDQRLLYNSVPKTAGSLPGLTTLRQLARDQHELAQDQRRLAHAVNQLAAAVHQVSRAGALQAAQRAADSRQLLVDSGIALGIVAVLAVLAGWLLAGRMLRPLRVITRTAQRISSVNLKERLALDGPQDELKDLGDTLDQLFSRLDAAFEAQRQFVANASHELRTPLTRQRALIQVALADPEASFSSLRAAHERVLVSEQHLEQMIDGLLALTRGQAGLERRDHLDLASLTAQAVHARESQLTDAGLHLDPALDPAPTDGDPRLLERLIANLIDNAIRHNIPGGKITITTGTQDDRTRLSIENDGPAVPDEQVERLFEPFQRLAGARTLHNNGHGLGLSIVQAIANAHHAELRACARAQGGLAIQISFPQASGTGLVLRSARPRREASAPVQAGLE